VTQITDFSATRRAQRRDGHARPRRRTYCSIRVRRHPRGERVTRIQESSRPSTWSSIVLAADLALPENHALGVGLKLASLYGARLIAAHVPTLGGASPSPGGAAPSETGDEGQVSESLKQILAPQLAAVSHDMLECRGEPWPWLRALLERALPQALVLELSRRARETPALSGTSRRASPAEEICLRAPCAVVTVDTSPPAGAGEIRGAKLERILLVTDFSVESLAAAPAAVSLASRAQAQLILLYAGDSARQKQTNAICQTLRDLVPLGTRLLLKPECRVERGVLAEVALKAAAEDRADLLVLGIPRPEAGAAATAAGALGAAWRVCREAKCAVLTVRG